MKITNYNLCTGKTGVDVKIALVSDLHARNPKKVIAALEQIQPDIIICAGDIFECFENKNTKRNYNGWNFFEKAVKISPVYYCLGNHETEGNPDNTYPEIRGYKSIPQHVIDRLMLLGVHTVFDEYECLSEDLCIGGLLSAQNRKLPLPNEHFINELSSLNKYKILICHHPEYYDTYLADKDIDLILAGHAHGGQWRIFGHGIWSPSQGVFPKYTSGIHDGKLVISRGCANYTRPIRVPRFFNPCEVLSIKINSI